MVLTETYRIFHLDTKEYTFFSTPHGSFSKVDHIFGNKASINRYKKIKIMPCIFSDHHSLKLDFNNKTQENLHTHGN
jgi:exonuclease III